MALTPEQLEARLREAAQGVAKPDGLMKRLALIGEAKAKPRTPVATGTLRRSVMGEVRSPVVGVVGATARYARFVHDGTKYMEGRPFIEEGIAEGLPQMQEEAARYADQVLRKVGG